MSGILDDGGVGIALTAALGGLIGYAVGGGKGAAVGAGVGAGTEVVARSARAQGQREGTAAFAQAFQTPGKSA